MPIGKETFSSPGQTGGGIRPVGLATWGLMCHDAQCSRLTSHTSALLAHSRGEACSVSVDGLVGKFCLETPRPGDVVAMLASALLTPHGGPGLIQPVLSGGAPLSL